jgi:hypothetical protein
MMMRVFPTALLVVTVMGAAVPAAAADDQKPADDQRSARACAAEAAGSYGVQCHGSTFTGSAFELVTIIGTVKGTRDGFFEGYATFNSSGGSVLTHVAGQATFGPSCFGHIAYTTNEIVLPGGATIPLPPIFFDFIAVDDGKEILGTGVAPPGMTNEDVPRLTCRLVRRHR